MLQANIKPPGPGYTVTRDRLFRRKPAFQLAQAIPTATRMVGRGAVSFPPHQKLSQVGNSLKMANYTSAPEDEYDVLIEDNLTNNEIEPCTSYDPKILLAQLVPHLYTTLFMVGLLDNILAVLILVKYKGLNYNLDKSVQITKIIATIHCCVNPLLYVFLDNAFREHLRRHLCCLCDDTAPQPTEEYAQDTSRGEHHLSTNM
ncbi:Chemokine C-C motif receptor-like 2 [Camelus dromedarius]|uniref:Chemokine C-C motif receptor-like 2 n=1 Tax=Camelus dromedarius TaxID=9838 RepID=A0A5N4D078_CAMDR|nr:Chemokine C-C motif receptor-like 2 [Camelus dromedarius]